ncbi:hypothetical protein D3C78_1069540 [compost metagenome]
MGTSVCCALITETSTGGLVLAVLGLQEVKLANKTVDRIRNLVVQRVMFRES